MLKPEEFAEIAQAVSDEQQLTHQQAIDLVRTVQQMDLQLIIGQNALQLSMDNAFTAIPALAEKVLERAGRTDKKIKKNIAALAAEAVNECDLSVQGYIAGAVLEAAQLLGISLYEFMGVDEAEVEQYVEAANEEPAV
jgi:hypothetical protein